MIDNPEKAARLLAALKEAVPFRERLIKHLRGQHEIPDTETRRYPRNAAALGV
jgi:hypothetical protein